MTIAELLLKESGETRPTSDQLTQLEERIQSADEDAARAAGRIGYLSILAPLAAPLPILGDSIANAPSLVRFAAEVAGGLEEVHRGLEPVLGTQKPPLVRIHEALLRHGDAIEKGVGQLRDASLMASELRQVQWWEALDLDGPLAQLEGLRPQFDAVLDLLHEREVLERVLGFTGAQTVLVLGQNDHEIRPTGGFIGSIGLVTIDRGQIQAMEFGDSATFAPGEPKVPPQAFSDFYGASEWHIRDANWWPDFPTSAAAAVDFIERDRGVRVDSVLAINTTLLGSLVGHFEPVNITDEIAAPATQELDADWTVGASIEVESGGEAVLIRAEVGNGRHALAYSRRGLSPSEGRVTLSVEVRSGGHRWVAFGDSSDREWHAAFFDLQTGEVASHWGALEVARIDPSDRPGWYRLEVQYASEDTETITAWVEIAGGPGATAGFQATGEELLQFDKVAIDIHDASSALPLCTFVAGATMYLAGEPDRCDRIAAFDEPLTEENWLASLERNLVDEGGKSGKQHFLVPIIEELFRRIDGSTPEEFVGLGKLLVIAAEERHLQWFHVEPEIEAVARQIGVAGVMVPPPPVDDFLAVIDTNLSNSKIQPAITRDVTYLRQRDDHVTVIARWENELSKIPVEQYQRLTRPGLLFDPVTRQYTSFVGPYGAYVRFYVPNGSTLLSMRGFDGPPRIEYENGFTVFSGFISVLDGEEQIVTLYYRTPLTVERGLQIWKQGGTIRGEWRVLEQGPDGQQHDLFSGELRRDHRVEFVNDESVSPSD